MDVPIRPTLRTLFRSDRRLEVFFYTSNLPKYLHAATVFEQSGLILKHFKSKTDPYNEDYAVGKERLLTKAIKEIVSMIGKQSLFFVEDTSLRIDALSKPSVDFPGLAVKEWFTQTSFEQCDAELRKKKNKRSATIKSDIGLHVPGLPRPLFFHGEVSGQIAETPPTFSENERFPWLTPNTFNGWFIPDGADKRLGEMSLEESWKYDFRTRALESLLNRLEEYAAALNLPPHAYSRLRHVAPSNQLHLFPELNPVFVVLGKTCAGKSTFGELVAKQHGLHWIEASKVLRTFKSEYDDEPGKDFDFARHTLESKGQDVVARKILQLYANEVLDGMVITGFRTIEELEAIKAQVPHAQVVLVESSDRARFQRHLARGRLDSIKTVREFNAHDVNQWSFGLLRVAEDFADIRITNERSIQDFWQQIEFLLATNIAKPFPGVSWGVNPRHGITNNQLYRCLAAVNDAGHSLSCDEIQELTKMTGAPIRHNNANKVLKRVPELAKRYDMENERVRYEITNAGRAYVRYMKARFESPKNSVVAGNSNERMRR